MNTMELIENNFKHIEAIIESTLDKPNLFNDNSIPIVESASSYDSIDTLFDDIDDLLSE